MEKKVFIVWLKGGRRIQFISHYSDIELAYEEVENKYPEADYIEPY